MIPQVAIERRIVLIIPEATKFETELKAADSCGYVIARP